MMKLFTRFLPIVAFITGFQTVIICQNQIIDQSEIAFVGVHVLPMTGKDLLSNQTVIVKNGKISEIDAKGSIQPSATAYIVEAEGKYLLPGIAEMHAHVPTPVDGNDEMVKETLFLYLSNGITLIRGMLGQPYHLELKKKISSGEILGPRLYTSSPSFNGNSVKTKEEARQKVTQYKKDGYDFLKIHPGVQLDVFEEIVNTSRKVGITYAGHVPAAVGIRRAIAFRYASIDHLDGYIDGLVPKTFHIDRNQGGLFGYNFTGRADKANIVDLVKRTQKNNIWIVPTQSLLVRWVSPKSSAEMANEPEMVYIKPATRLQWRQSKEQTIAGMNYNADTARLFIDLRNQLLKEMEKQGVNLLLGSDAPQVFNVPGFSIQHEMQSMAAAGVSNYTILQSGTANPAKFFKAAGQFGTIQKGAAADLILLDANPLNDITNMQYRAGVMVGGKWLSKDFIEAKLAAIAQKYQ